jgi:hypothetical protein
MAILGMASLEACTSAPPPPQPTPSPTVGVVVGRYIPCSPLGPFSGLQIQAVADGTVRATAVTGAQGDFGMDLPPGSYDLTTPGGGRLGTVSVAAGKTTPFSQVSYCA